MWQKKIPIVMAPPLRPLAQPSREKASECDILSIKLLKIDFWVNDLRNQVEEDAKCWLSFSDIIRHYMNYHIHDEMGREGVREREQFEDFLMARFRVKF